MSTEGNASKILTVEQAAKLRRSQVLKAYSVRRVRYPRIRYSAEAVGIDSFAPCNDCGAVAGQFHAAVSCQFEQCPCCHALAMTCPCLQCVTD